ncbi:hypothetical protein [Rhodococcus sp. NPDC058514]|uniref:hypothetical protein n=1 Tax=unclassified Rhodococcus (in: high G+C Gram-positive bacteria) TaxID=192944 RepID=UPI003652D510
MLHEHRGHGALGHAAPLLGLCRARTCFAGLADIDNLAYRAGKFHEVPKRTNEFQEMVAIIHSHLSGDAVITESKMLKDLVSGEEREVDTCIETTTAGYPVIISIECRDHKRKQSVGWVEEMNSKHQRLPTNVLVLASSSGFSKSAITKAKSFGITTVVPGELEPGAFGSEIVGKLDALCMKTFALTAAESRFWVEGTDDSPAETVLAFPTMAIFRADGTAVALAQSLANAMVQKLNVDNDAFRDALGDEKSFTVGTESPHLLDPETGKPHDIFLQAEEPTGPNLRRIERIEVTGPADVVVAEIPLTHRELQAQKAGEFQRTGYAAGLAEFGDGSVLVVATETPTGERRVTTRVIPGRQADKDEDAAS